MSIFNETNELAEKISNLLNKDGIEEELGTVLIHILEEADERLMNYLEDQAEKRILPAHAHARACAEEGIAAATHTQLTNANNNETLETSDA